jgi:hypothetical protein
MMQRPLREELKPSVGAGVGCKVRVSVKVHAYVVNCLFYRLDEC